MCIRDRVLAKRVDPFIREPKLEPPRLDPKASGLSHMAGELPESVEVAMKNFLGQPIGAQRSGGERPGTEGGLEFGE